MSTTTVRTAIAADPHHSWCDRPAHATNPLLDPDDPTDREDCTSREVTSTDRRALAYIDSRDGVPHLQLVTADLAGLPLDVAATFLAAVLRLVEEARR